MNKKTQYGTDKLCIPIHNAKQQCNTAQSMDVSQTSWTVNLIISTLHLPLFFPVYHSSSLFSALLISFKALISLLICFLLKNKHS